MVITTIPASGSLKLSGVAVTAGQEIPVANLGSLVFTQRPTPTAPPTPRSPSRAATTARRPTAVSTSTGANTFTLNVTAVNDAPVVTIIGDFSDVNEGVTHLHVHGDGRRFSGLDL